MEKKLLIAYMAAYQFLVDEVGEEALDKELIGYHSKRFTTMPALYKRMLGSLKNRGGYVNFIANIEDMAPILIPIAGFP